MWSGGTGPCVKVCCGPRCGTVPEHRAIYDAVEAACPGVTVVPTMCRGLCGDGVTLVREDGEKIKARDADEARAKLSGGLLETCQPSRY